jgi:hypothetical protein
MVSSFLGFEPMAFERKLHIRQPLLPNFVDRIRVKQLRVGDAKVDLHYERQSDDSTKVEVLTVDGQLEVITE